MLHLMNHQMKMSYDVESWFSMSNIMLKYYMNIFFNEYLKKYLYLLLNLNYICIYFTNPSTEDSPHSYAIETLKKHNTHQMNTP